MRDFRSLKTWQCAHKMVLAVYEATRAFPHEETYGLVSQIRRPSSSVAVNIVEGCGCERDREFARYLNIGFRSAIETECHLLLARDLQYLQSLDYDDLTRQVTDVKRMLSALIRKLRADGRALNAPDGGTDDPGN